MTMGLLITLELGCTQHDVTIQKMDPRGAPTGIFVNCKIASWHNEGGPTYSGCSDGKIHGMNSPDDLVIWLPK